MSKTSRKKRRSRKYIKPHKQKTAPPPKQRPSKQKSNIKKFVLFVVIAILTAIPFSLGKYFEFNFPDPYDSGAYAYSAKHILEGAEIGVDEKPSAQIGTLLVNMLGVWLSGDFSETGPKFMQMLLQAAALLLMFIAMRKLFGTLPAAVGVIIASVYLSAPVIAKFGNVKEQYMIAFMILAISSFVLYQLGGKWRWAILAGAFLSWAPLFKATGTSAIGAVGLFVVAQPLLKHRTFRQTGVDILLLLAGVVAAIGPLYLWIIAWDVQLNLPYSFAWKTLTKMLPAKAAADAAAPPQDYIAGTRKLISFSEQWPKVLRFYGVLILPVALAAGAILARILRMIWPAASAKKTKNYDRFVLLFAAWWILDMAFVWISPRSYDQYYLPLNASAAMLGGYLIALYCDNASAAVNKPKWIALGLGALLLMVIMSWHIFFGLRKSPFSGTVYINRSTREPERRRGYTQKFKEISGRRKNNWRGPWEDVGEYIRNNSEPSDKIYVWGWFPGIYVSAQRFSAASKAVMMPRPTPARMAEMIAELLAEFEQERPKFIVDSRKLHVPMNRPPYELWPIMPKGFMGATERQFLPLDKNLIEAYDKAWSKVLRDRFDEAEALRYEALKPLREFVMNNYTRVGMFSRHVLFQLKDSTASREPQ